MCVKYKVCFKATSTPLKMYLHQIDLCAKSLYVPKQFPCANSVHVPNLLFIFFNVRKASLCVDSTSTSNPIRHWIGHPTEMFYEIGLSIKFKVTRAQPMLRNNNCVDITQT